MKNSLFYIIIGILGGLLIFSNLWRDEPEIVTKIETDTITIVKVDTLVRYEPKYITKTVVDTLRLIINETDTVYLPKEQKYYTEPNKYSAWVSGYEPNLDSIKVFNKIEYKTITNTVTNDIYKKSWGLYVEGGFMYANQSFAPEVGLTLTMPNRVSLGVGVGVLNGQTTYRAKVGYNLFK